MDDESLALFEQLSNSDGPSGFEERPIRLVKERMAAVADNITNDRIGSLVFEKVGDADGPKVLIPGHVDEVGFVVTHINDSGFISFLPLGGWYDQVLLGQRVKIMTVSGDVEGVIAAKPPHVMDAEERKKVVTKDKMFIDVGCSNKDEVGAVGIRTGDPIVPVSSFSVFTRKTFKDGEETGVKRVAMGKAFDNRIGAYLAMKTIINLATDGVEHPNVVVGATTVQEEVGLRGARTVANMVQPDIALVVDTDISGDVPGMEPTKAPVRMGGGVVIGVIDRGMITNPRLRRLVVEVCEANDIPYQLSYMDGGATDAGAIHVSNIGCPSVNISISTRHIHSHVGMIDLEDVDHAERLLIELVRKLDQKTVDSLTSI